MNMKDHILAALREQFDSWEKLLTSLSEEQIIAPHFDHDWSIKDVLAHLWGWQQISIARIEGGTLDREPELPRWVMELRGVWEENANQTNARIYEINHEKLWTEIHQNWRDGFLRLLELGSEISERNLLDGDRYPWLKGYALAFILVASYDHHQEHFEKLIDWLGNTGIDRNEGSTSVRRTTITRLPHYQTTQLSNYLPKQPPQRFPSVFCIIFFAGLKPLAQYVEALWADERVGFQPTSTN